MNAIATFQTLLGTVRNVADELRGDVEVDEDDLSVFVDYPSNSLICRRAAGYLINAGLGGKYAAPELARLLLKAAPQRNALKFYVEREDELFKFPRVLSTTLAWRLKDGSVPVEDSLSLISAIPFVAIWLVDDDALCVVGKMPAERLDVASTGTVRSLALTTAAAGAALYSFCRISQATR